MLEWLRKLILRSSLKVLWSVGGQVDAVDGLPRVSGDTLRPHLCEIKAGDALLVGNNGTLSHVMMVVGDNRAIHSMATEKTMRGMLGSLLDALRRPLWWLTGHRERTGVIEESITAFFDRFERDTWVVLRRADLSTEQVAAGLSRVRALVGAEYDYAFRAGDDHFYCTEVVGEFLDAATGRAMSETLPTRRVSVPLLLHTEAIEPIALWTSGAMEAVLANDAASVNYGDRLEGVTLAGTQGARS